METNKPKLLKLNIQFFADSPEILNLEQALTGQELLIYSRNLATPQNYLADLFFPAKETSELTVDVIREGSRLPVMAQIAELGTQVEYGSREGMSGDRVSIPKIQRGRAMDEKLVRLLLQSGLRANEFAEIRRTQLDDAGYSVDGIKARREWIAMQAISTGGVTYSEGGVQLKVDFGFTDDQKPILSGSSRWNDTENSTPLDDIQLWKTKAAEKGILLTRAMTSTKIISLLKQNDGLRKAYHGATTPSAPQLNDDQLNTVLQANSLPSLVAYDTMARTENKALVNGRAAFATQRMMPENRFILLPDGPLGDYLWAQTTEEMMNEIEAEQTAESGIFVFRKVNKHPIRVETIGVNLSFPVLGQNDSVVSATVL